MSGILVSGKIQKLLDRLTAARAGYLDTINTNLNATITSRASATDYTTARAAKLDNLDQAISTVAPLPPETSGIKGVSTSRTDFTTAATYVGVATTDTDTNTGTWNTILSASTSVGILQFVAVYQSANSTSKNIQCRLQIDGNTVYSSATNFWSSTAHDDFGVAIIGSYAEGSFAAGVAFDRIPFTDSFSIDWNKTSAGTDSVTMGCYCRYYLTG